MNFNEGDRVVVGNDYGSKLGTVVSAQGDKVRVQVDGGSIGVFENSKVRPFYSRLGNDNGLSSARESGMSMFGDGLTIGKSRYGSRNNELDGYDKNYSDFQHKHELIKVSGRRYACGQWQSDEDGWRAAMATHSAHQDEEWAKKK